MRVTLVGLGAVGRRVARQLMADPATTSVVAVHRDDRRAELATEGLDDRLTLRRGRASSVPPGTDVVVITRPERTVKVAEAALRVGAHVVAVADSPDEVRRLLELDEVARASGVTVAVGVAMAPGLSCLLAGFGASRLDRVTEVHVASHGTGGPACARRHHAALRSVSTEWVDGEWRRRPGGSGRELVWFPEPVGGADCYRADLADPVLLVPAFGDVERVTAKLEATRRDRLTSPLPMLRPPHREGTVGAVRVEVRGRVGGAADSVVLGGSGRPAIVAGTLAALTARWASDGRLAPGAGGMASRIDDHGALLALMVARGISVAEFGGGEGAA